MVLSFAVGLISAVLPLVGTVGSDCEMSFEQGREEFAARHFDRAAHAFEEALGSCPPSQQTSLLLNLARSQMVSQHVPDSLLTLNRLLRLEPRNTAGLKLQSDALFLLGRESEAEQSLLSARAIEPQNAELPYSLGRIYYQQHRYSEALTQFQAAVALDPKSYKTHDNLGLCYEALNESQQAITHYTKAIELVYKDHPEYDWPYGNLAALMLKLGSNQQAFDLAAEAAFRNPQSARNFYLTGKALTKLGKWDLSIRWLQRAAELDPAYAEPHYLLARAYRTLGQDAEAGREFNLFRKIAAAQPREKR